MAVRKFKPTTPGQRHKIIGTFEEITASVPEKSLEVISRSSVSLTSDVRKMVFPPSLRQLSTIPTVRLVSHSFSTQTVKSVILLLPTD